MDIKSPYRFTLIVLAILALDTTITPTHSHAGAWSQKKGHYYTKFSAIFYRADEGFDASGDKGHLSDLDDTFKSDQTFFYLEYGLSKRLTLISQLSSGTLTAENNLGRQRTTDVGDFNIGGKYQLIDGPIILSPYATLKLPAGYDKRATPPLGTGDADLELRLLAARSLHPLPLYLGVEGGYRFRGGPFSNQIPYFFEVGATPHEKVFVKVYLEGKNTLTGGSGNMDAMDSMSTQVSEGDFSKIGFNAAYNVSGVLWADLLYDTIFTGKNVGAGRSFGIGLSYIY